MRGGLSTLALLAGLLPVGTAVATPENPAPEKQACKLVQLASLPMETLPNGEVAVPAAINGRNVEMLVDTGSVYSSVSITTMQEMGLKQQPILGGEVSFPNNMRMWSYTQLASFSLGPARGENLQVFILPPGWLDGNLSGMLGAEVMRNFDIEFDFAGGKFNVMVPNSCTSAPVYWTHDNFAEVPMKLDRNSSIVVSAGLDGRPLTVIVDTGSSGSLLSFDAAQDLFGWKEGDRNLKRLPDEHLNGGAAIPVYRYPFSYLTFEGIAVANPDILMIPHKDFDKHGRDDAQVIIGMSILRQLHLYIGYKAQKLYLSAAESR